MQFRMAIGIAVALAAGVCSAATYMWTGGAGDGKFSSPANWGVESAAFTAEDTCVFLNTTALDVTVDEPVTVGTITFSGSGALTVGGEATLTVTKMTNVYSQQPVFNCPVAFAGTYRVDFATDSVNFAGGVSATGPDDSIPDNAASTRSSPILSPFHQDRSCTASCSPAATPASPKGPIPAVSRSSSRKAATPSSTGWSLPATTCASRCAAD